jgi:hypothetical protein
MTHLHEASHTCVHPLDTHVYTSPALSKRHDDVHTWMHGCCIRDDVYTSKHARDGLVDEKFSEIPDGFYLVANAHTPEPAWQQAIIDAVAKVTHIAPADENGEIIGDPMTGPGVVTFDGRSIGLCGSHTDARFSTTTEVYPDSPGVSGEECNLAQVAAIVAGINSALTMSA